MAVNVTYLLGAGASFDVIPLVKSSGGGANPSISQDILSLSDKLKRRREDTTEDQNLFLNQMVKDFEEIGNKARFFSSPDTYAKSLFLAGNQRSKIGILKRVLSFYITWKQLKNPRLVDRRYIPFLAGILEETNNIKIPDNIKILSWNYDFQLELALRHFKSELEDLSEIQNHFKIIPTTKNLEQPSVVHLNGVAGMFKDHKGIYFNACEKSDVISEEDFLLKQSIEDFRTWSTKGHEIDDLLSFAWEIESHQRIKEAVKIMNETEILVVIGYSFPFFNRKIDRILFESLLTDSSGVKLDLKIYIQDPVISDDHIKFLRQSFEIVDDIEIEPLRDVNQFFLPPEL